MFEALKQSIFTSIGFANLTQERSGEIVSELAKHVPLTEQQAKDFSEEVVRRSEAARKDLGTQIDQQIDHALIQMGLMKNELRKVSESTGDAFSKMIDDRISDAMERLGVARSEEIEALTRRIELLEKKLQAK
ncbi:MAG: phasin family protein [Pirellula sp.]